jgi:hypothetical protein
MEPLPLRYGWAWFGGWVIVGAGLAFGMISFIPVLPLAAVIAFLLARKQRSAQAWWGAISGAGLLLLYVAYLQRRGPGTHCRSIGTSQYTGTQCDEYLDPRPWLVIGVVLVVAGVVAFVVQRRRMAQAHPGPV